MMNKIVNWSLIVVSLLALVLSGCNSQTPEPPVQATVEKLSELKLINTSWELESLGSPDNLLPLLPDTHLTVNYLPERYTGSGGCNWYLGVYGVEGGNITMEVPATTEIICEPADLMQQEATFMSALLNVTEYRMEGDKLAAYTVNDQRLLTFVPIQPVPFEGTTWDLKMDYNEEMWMAPIPNTTVTVQFEGNQLSGFASCNSYTAAIEKEGETLTMSNVAATQKTCADPVNIMDQETAYLSALSSVAGFKQVGNALALLDAEGEAILMFGTK